MPSKNLKQHNLMAMVANNPAAAKRVGIPQSVGKEFTVADRGKKFDAGGVTKPETQQEQQRRMRNLLDGVSQDMMQRWLKEQAAEKTANKGTTEMYDPAYGKPREPGEKKPLYQEKMWPSEKKPAFAKGGPVKKFAKPMPAMGAPAKPMGMKKGGAVIDGVAQRGKTKGKQITMKRGGKC